MEEPDHRDAVLSPQERAAACPWKAFKAPDGRDYFHNSTTGQSVWVEPEELKVIRLALEAAAGRPAAAASRPTR